MLNAKIGAEQISELITDLNTGLNAELSSEVNVELNTESVQCGFLSCHNFEFINGPKAE